MRKFCKILFLALFGFLPNLCFTQNVTVSARIDSAEIWIGQQTRLTFEVSQPENRRIIAPLFPENIIDGLEIVEQSEQDTAMQDGHLLISRNYTLTSFDDTLYYIPPYPFVEGSDTFWSNSLSLKVIQPFEIDTASNQIVDIKTVYNMPFDWKKFVLIIIIVSLILAIMALVAAFLIYKLTRKKKTVEAVKYETRISPYNFAMTHLEEIKKSKIWQQNRSKEYHTELTDVIREYIDRNYGISCMEMTSEEIFEHLIFLNRENKTAYYALKQILTLADLVKFAKWNPVPGEHEQSLTNAFLFVNETTAPAQNETNEAAPERDEKP